MFPSRPRLRRRSKRKLPRPGMKPTLYIDWEDKPNPRNPRLEDKRPGSNQSKKARRRKRRGNRARRKQQQTGWGPGAGSMGTENG